MTRRIGILVSVAAVIGLGVTAVLLIGPSDRPMGRIVFCDPAGNIVRDLTFSPLSVIVGAISGR